MSAKLSSHTASLQGAQYEVRDRSCGRRRCWAAPSACLSITYKQDFGRTLKAHNSLQGAQYEVRDPVMRPAALLGGAEQPDVELRRFSDCTLPLVWWPKPCVPLDPLLDTLLTPVQPS